MEVKRRRLERQRKDGGQFSCIKGTHKWAGFLVSGMGHTTREADRYTDLSDFVPQVGKKCGTSYLLRACLIHSQVKPSDHSFFGGTKEENSKVFADL